MPATAKEKLSALVHSQTNYSDTLFMIAIKQILCGLCVFAVNMNIVPAPPYTAVANKGGETGRVQAFLPTPG